MTLQIVKRLVTICGLAGAVSAACGQPTGTPSTEPPPPASAAASDSRVPGEGLSTRGAWPEESRWTLRAEPVAWFAGLSGALTLPRASVDAGGNESTDLNDLNLDSQSVFTPLGEATLRRERWGFSFRGFGISSDQSSSGFTGRVGDIPIAAGDAVRSSADILSFEAEGLYTILRDARRRRAEGGYHLRPRLDLVAGLRVIDTDWQVSNLTNIPLGGGTASADETFFQPLAGLKFTMVIREEFTIDVLATGGGLPFGDQSSYGFDILVGGSWQPIPNLGVQFGYRALFLGLNSGEGDATFEYSGAVQGLYAGIVLEF